MRLFGLTIGRDTPLKQGAPVAPDSGTPAALTKAQDPQGLSTVDTRGGWWPFIREASTGAWQRGETIRLETGLSNATLFRCVAMISADIAKMCLELVLYDPATRIWAQTEQAAFSSTLRKPNHFQNRIQFITQWILSKLLHGNTYVLKARDNRNVVAGLYILDPLRVKPLVATDGSIYYQLMADNMSGLEEGLPAVPASEIIHDRWNTLFHPLVGVSPIYACAMPALQGLEIQRASTKFFRNGSKPGGILTAPAAISNDTAERLKATWDANYTGENVGKVAVLGDGLEFKSMAVTADNAQLIEQLKWTSETVAACFGVPAYKVGVGPAPLNNNVEALDQQYYSQCLQILIESLELCLTEGLELPTAPNRYAVQCDLDGLLRMDSATQVTTLAAGVLGALFKPDEARAKLNLGPVKGGDTVYLQQQNYSLAALDARDKAGPAPGVAAQSSGQSQGASDASDSATQGANDNLASMAFAFVARCNRDRLHA